MSVFRFRTWIDFSVFSFFFLFSFAWRAAALVIPALLFFGARQAVLMVMLAAVWQSWHAFRNADHLSKCPQQMISMLGEHGTFGIMMGGLLIIACLAFSPLDVYFGRTIMVMQVVALAFAGYGAVFSIRKIAADHRARKGPNG